MYDAREKARRDRQTENNDSRREGRLEGKIETLHMLQDLLEIPLSDEAALRALDLETLQRAIGDLRKRLRERKGS